MELSQDNEGRNQTIWQNMRAEPLLNTEESLEAAVMSCCLSASTLQKRDTKQLLRGFSAAASGLPTAELRGKHCWRLPAPLCLEKSFLDSSRQHNLSLGSQTAKGRFSDGAVSGVAVGSFSEEAGCRGTSASPEPDAM